MQLYEPAQIITKEGECKIALVLELNINVNSNGALSISSGGKSVVTQPLPVKEEEDKIDWAIPEFASERITFGKKVEE